MARLGSTPRTRLVGFYRRNFDWCMASLGRELRGCNSILDLGCGEDSPLRYFSRARSLGVDLFMPYIRASLEMGIHSGYILADLRRLHFRPVSFDAVIALDVLEHLSREEGSELLKRMEGWAIRKVIIITPNGFVAQTAYDMNPQQAHQSGWVAKDFRARGYRVWGVRGWRCLRGERAEVRFHPRLLWAGFSELTQPLAYWWPNSAFQLLCVKRVNGHGDKS